MATFNLGLTRTNELKATILLTPGEVRNLIETARRMGTTAADPAPPTIEVAEPDAGETPTRPGSSAE